MKRERMVNGVVLHHQRDKAYLHKSVQLCWLLALPRGIGTSLLPAIVAFSC